MTALLLCLVVASAGAQVYDRALHEQDLARILPVLRADVQAADERARERAASASLAAARARAMQDAAGEIARGADPLDWLRAHSREAVAPSTAVYQPACARALTAAAGRPSAMLSFGIDAPTGWLFVWKERDAGAIATGPPASRQRGAPGSSARPEALVQQTRAFYAGRNFEYKGERAPFEWQFMAADKRVSATIVGVNVFGRLEACRALATGPAVVIRAEDELFGQALASQEATTAGTAQRAFDAAVQKAGLSEAEYLNLKLQVLAARVDAAAEDRGARIAAANPNDEAIRRQNARFYREHREALEPLLARLANP